MLERFEGIEGRRRLEEALAAHNLLGGVDDLVKAVVSEGELLSFSEGDDLVEDQGTDNQIYFIIVGEVSILVNSREVARRQAGMHVGEMAMIDPTARRCATVRASIDSVVIRLDEPQFADLANRFPNLWRGLAVEIAERLRQRNQLVMPPNPRPFLFIGSSVESLPVARAIQLGLKHDDIHVKVWTDGVFGASHFPIDDLQSVVRTADFGLLVVAPEDEVLSRDVVESAPRDNVVFELGMCMGALTRSRSFMALPGDADVKIPTDLLGLTPLNYALGPERNFDVALGPVCEELRRVITSVGPK